MLLALCDTDAQGFQEAQLRKNQMASNAVTKPLMVLVAMSLSEECGTAKGTPCSKAKNADKGRVTHAWSPWQVQKSALFSVNQSLPPGTTNVSGPHVK